jgi:hypothetical protein
VQIASGERGQFRWRQDGFNFHFMSREGREGGEEVLQSNESSALSFRR